MIYNDIILILDLFYTSIKDFENEIKIFERIINHYSKLLTV